MLFAGLSALIRRQRPELVPVDGARLTRCGDRAWVADRELNYGGRNRLPVRMVVLADESDALSLYSPVWLDDGTVEALSGLGEVRRIIVPNRYHTLFVKHALETFPEAKLLLPEVDGCLAARLSTPGQHITEPTPISGGTEILPVRLRPGFEELVLYHDPAELLVVSHLMFNLHRAEGFLRWLHVINGVWQRPALSRLQRLRLNRDRTSLVPFYRWAMSKPFSQISMSHGQLITTEAREVFYRLFHGFSA